jgi:hypothetical protein
MTPDMDFKSSRGTGRAAGGGRIFARLFAWFRVVIGALALVSGARAAPVSAASEVDKPSATDVPASWQVFAARLQLRFQERLASDDKNAVSLRNSLTKRAQAASVAPTLIVRAWLLADGKVSRVELEGSQDQAALHDLGAVLIGESIGAVPPDMLQPLRLRLSLGAKARPEN